MGSPRAKSLDCVVNIPKRPAFPTFIRDRISVRITVSIKTKTDNFAIRIPDMNLQSMAPRFSVARFWKSKAGSASLPTSSLMARASPGGMILKRPIKYPTRMTAKDCAIAGNKLLDSRSCRHGHLQREKIRNCIAIALENRSVTTRISRNERPKHRGGRTRSRESHQLAPW